MVYDFDQSESVFGLHFKSFRLQVEKLIVH